MQFRLQTFSIFVKNSEDTDKNIYKSLIFDRLGVDQGMIMENVVAQMLCANGHKLYFHEFYYREKESATEKKYPLKIQDRYIIYTKDLKQEGDILYVPIYMTGCL